VKITDILEPDSISIDLSAETKKEALSKVLDLIKRKFTKIERQKITKILLDREKLSSTACEHSIAIPHARLEFIDYFITAIGKFKTGVDFNSFDTEKTFLVFLILGPKDKPGEFLKLLASISKLLKNEEIKDKLLKTDKIESFYKIIKNFERESIVSNSD